MVQAGSKEICLSVFDFSTEEKKAVMSLENKLLLTSRLQGSGLLQSNLGLGNHQQSYKTDVPSVSVYDKPTYRELGGDSRNKTRPVTSLNNDILQSSVAKQLTKNKLLGQTSYSYKHVSEKKPSLEKDADKLQLSSEARVTKTLLQNKRLEKPVASKGLVEKSLTTNFLLRSSNSIKTMGIQRQTIDTNSKNINFQLKPKALLASKEKRSYLSGPTALLQSKGDARDKDAAVEQDICIKEVPLVKPIYKLEFDDEDLSREFLGRNNARSFKNTNFKDPGAEKERLAVQKCKVCKFLCEGTSTLSQPMISVVVLT